MVKDADCHTGGDVLVVYWSCTGAVLVVKDAECHTPILLGVVPTVIIMVQTRIKYIHLIN